MYLNVQTDGQTDDLLWHNLAILDTALIYELGFALG